MTISSNHDSLDAIASDLDQLADETGGNQSRPSAEDICARVRQAAKRIRAFRPVDRLIASQPVVGAFAPTFTGQSLTATHPRALGDIPAAYETPEEKHRAALGEDYQAGGNANLAADEVIGDDLPGETDPADSYQS